MHELNVLVSPCVQVDLIVALQKPPFSQTLREFFTFVLILNPSEAVTFIFSKSGWVWGLVSLIFFKALNYDVFRTCWLGCSFKKKLDTAGSKIYTVYF